jgi:hypothetical protein
MVIQRLGGVILMLGAVAAATVPTQGATAHAMALCDGHRGMSGPMAEARCSMELADALANARAGDGTLYGYRV